MSNDDRNETLRRIIEPIVRDRGLELWGIEYLPAGKRTLLRIYIDSENGVHVDQCAEISRHVGLALDVEDVIPGSFILEVSSPGLDRMFFEPGQLNRYLGREISIQLHEPLEGRKKWQGQLMAVHGSLLRLQVGAEELEFEWNGIKKARLVVSDVKPKKGS
ncbi:MAG: ribosome maturation factor RimP [Desulfovibrionales bacterium]